MKSINMKDHFSELPNHLIHQIMSFLPPIETLKFLFLSKTLSFLFFSSPTLYLNSNTHFESHFIDHARLTLNRRQNTHLQTLIFNLRFQSSDFETLHNSIADLLRELASFATENRLSALHISCRYDSYLPNATLGAFSASILSSTTIRYLNLCGIHIDGVASRVLTVDCALIEDFAISSCRGIEVIQFSPNVKFLKSVRVSNCRWLERIRIGECQLRLESFTYEAIRHYIWPCNIEIHRDCRERIKFLKLDCADINDYWLRNDLSDCVSLERLELYRCSHVSSVVLRNSRIRFLKLRDCLSVREIDLALPSLEFLQVKGLKHLKPDCYRINIGGCTNLKSLEITGGFVLSKQWIANELATRFSCLESLKLDGCYHGMGKSEIRFRLENLTSLELISWTLVGLQIECPKLSSFKYSGFEFGSKPVVITSSLKNAEIQFNTISLSCNKTSLKNYLSFFRRCNTLSLTIDNYKDNFVITERLRKGLIHPPNELKHLKIPMNYLHATENVVGFVDSLLWLAVRPESISLFWWFSKEESVIKLYYSRGDETNVRKGKKDLLTCCSRYRSVKCWRHGLTEVVIENFTGDHREILLDYFVENTRAIITVVVDGYRSSFFG